jgi:hypothetical protein
MPGTNINCHDWRLTSYSVRDDGTRIMLHLLWNYPGQKRREHDIHFSGVGAYRFIHGDGSILSDVDEAPIAAFIRNEDEFIRRTAGEIGLRHWPGDICAYRDFLETAGFRYWTIGSATGFRGFVVAQSAEALPVEDRRIAPVLTA